MIDINLHRRIKHSFIVAGCDVGESDKDRNTGLVIVKYMPEKPLEILYNQRMLAGTAPGLVRTLVQKYEVDYLVMDAPLLPVYTDKPPIGHIRADGTQRYFRPHEDMIRPGTLDALRLSLPAIDEPVATSFYKLLNRMQPQPTFRKDDPSPFVQAAQNIRLAIADVLPMITDYTDIAAKGTLEGFPKAFLIPFLPLHNEAFTSKELPMLIEPRVVKRGTVDSHILRWIFGNNDFWQRDGIDLVISRNIDNEEVFDNKDLICGFSMALQGILYATGRAMVITSQLRHDSGYNFGHIIMPSLKLFEPWAAQWFQQRLMACANSHTQSEILCYCPSEGDAVLCQ